MEKIIPDVKATNKDKLNCPAISIFWNLRDHESKHNVFEMEHKKAYVGKSGSKKENIKWLNMVFILKKQIIVNSKIAKKL